MSMFPASTDAQVGLLPQPYLLFLGDAREPGFAKTAYGLRDWADDLCVGEWSCGATVRTGLPLLSPAEARARGARGLVIGVANLGGFIPEAWIPDPDDAVVERQRQHGKERPIDTSSAVVLPVVVNRCGRIPTPESAFGKALPKPVSGAFGNTPSRVRKRTKL